jgi:flagellar biosynthesis protein FliQ
MNESDIIDISRESIFVMLKLCGPVMLVALVVGVGVSFIQALTQIQESTVAFIPKILAVFGSMLFFLPFMLATLNQFMQEISERIMKIGGGG